MKNSTKSFFFLEVEENPDKEMWPCWCACIISMNTYIHLGLTSVRGFSAKMFFTSGATPRMLLPYVIGESICFTLKRNTEVGL